MNYSIVTIPPFDRQFFLMAIYEKSVKINISNKELTELLKFI